MERGGLSQSIQGCVAVKSGIPKLDEDIAKDEAANFGTSVAK